MIRPCSIVANPRSRYVRSAVSSTTPAEGIAQFRTWPVCLAAAPSRDGDSTKVWNPVRCGCSVKMLSTSRTGSHLPPLRRSSAETPRRPCAQVIDQTGRHVHLSIATSSVDPPSVLGGHVIDTAVGAMLLLPDAYARSAAMYALLSEMSAAIGWLHNDSPSPTDTAELERASLRQVVAAARSHAWRMDLLRPDAAEDGLR